MKIWCQSLNLALLSCRRVIVSGPWNVPHPFSVAVFEDQVYWSDLTRMAILRVSKYDGLDSLKKIYKNKQKKVMNIRTLHSSLQPKGMYGPTYLPPPFCKNI